MGQVRDGLKETRQSLTTVFGNPALRRINLALGGSMIGDWAYATAITVWAYGVGGAALVGGWYAIRLGLMAVVAPFASVFVDRLPRKRVMILTDLVRAALVMIATAVIFVDGPAWVVLTLATLASLVGAPFRPAKAALMPSLARNPVELTAANGVGSTVESLSFFLGPAIAGSLLAVTDVEPVFLLNVLTFLWSAVLVAGVHPPSGAAPVEAAKPSTAAGGDEEGEEPELGFVAEALAGFKTIRRDRDLLLIMVLMCGQTLVAGALAVIVVAVAVDLIDLGPQGVGYLDSVLGVGALIGGVVAMSRASKQRLAWDFGVGVILWALPLTFIAAWASPVAAFAAMLVIGLANPLVDVNLDTMVQRLTPDQVLGRVFGAIEAAFIGAMALGALMMPILISTIGLRWGLTAIGLGVTALVAPFIPRLLTMDRFLREPEGLALIRALPIFAPLARPVVERLALALDRLEVPAGTEIITEGDVGDKFYVIESGLVAATYRGAPLSQSGPGEPFGEIALLHDVPRTATVTAVEDTVLRVLDREDFLSAVTGNDQVLDRTEALVRRRIPTG